MSDNKTVNGHKTKEKGYKHSKADARKNKRQVEAEQRNSNWAKMSPENKLAELDKRPGQSKKQRARLNKLIKK